jgi:hypothetical protein
MAFSRVDIWTLPQLSRRRLRKHHRPHHSSPTTNRCSSLHPIRSRSRIRRSQMQCLCYCRRCTPPCNLTVRRKLPRVRPGPGLPVSGRDPPGRSQRAHRHIATHGPSSPSGRTFTPITDPDLMYAHIRRRRGRLAAMRTITRRTAITHVIVIITITLTNNTTKNVISVSSSLSCHPFLVEVRYQHVVDVACLIAVVGVAFRGLVLSVGVN